MQKLKLDLESLRKIETFEYKLDIFLKLDSECPFWHNSQICPDCTVRTASGCVPILNHLELHVQKPPRSACKFTSITVQHHLDLRACLCLHQNSFFLLGMRANAHLNNKNDSFGGASYGPRALQIPESLQFLRFCAPFLATSHGGGALVALVVKVVGGAEVPGSNPRASPLYTYIYTCARFVITYGFMLRFLVYGAIFCVYIFLVCLYGMFNIYFGWYKHMF
jgi:hypothetical protein